MAADRIEIKVTADTREATANLSRFSDSAKAAAESAGRIGAGVLGAGAAMGAAAYKAAEFAAAIEQQDMAIRRLGPAYDAVRAATNGVVSAQEALKAQQTLVQAGIRVSTEQLATITRAAREYALATGTEMTQSLEQLTDALRTGSAEGLGRFGVSLEQGVSGTRAFGSALEQLQRQQADTAVSARTMREDLDKLPEGLMALGRAAMSAAEGPLDSLMRALTGLVGASTGLRGVLRELGEAGDTLRQRERQQATDAAAMQRLDAQDALYRTAQTAGIRVSREQIRGLSAQRLTALQQRVAQVGRVIEQRGNLGERLTVSLAGGGVFGRMQRQQQIEEAIRQAQIEQQVESIPAARAPAAQRAVARGGGGGDGGLGSAWRGLRQAYAEAMVRGAPRLPIERPDPGETMAQYLSRLTSIQRSLTSQALTPQQLGELAAQQQASEQDEVEARREKAEAAFAETRRGMETPQERAARERAKIESRGEMLRGAEQRARAESFGGRFAGALGIELDERGRVPALDIAQAGVDTLATSLASLTSGFSELFNTLAAGSMSAGEAFQQFAAKTLSSLGQMAVNKGVFYTFEGIASLFTNPVAAPLYFAAGAGLIALGAGLGAAGSAVAPRAPAGGSAAPSAARSASGASPRGDMGGGGNVTIVLSSLVPPGPRELQGLVHAQRQAGRYGLGDARMVPRQVRA